MKAKRYALDARCYEVIWGQPATSGVVWLVATVRTLGPWVIVEKLVLCAWCLGPPLFPPGAL